MDITEFVKARPPGLPAGVGTVSVTVEQLRAAVEAHEPAHGMTQWYVDEHVIDCDAGEFWAVIAAVLEKP